MKKLFVTILIFNSAFLFCQEKDSIYDAQRVSEQLVENQKNVSTSKKTILKKIVDTPFADRLGAGGLNVAGNVTFLGNNIVSINEPGLIVNVNSDFNRNNDNNGLILGYIDIDDVLNTPGNNTTFSSSMSTLNLPTCSRVVYAGLYWAAVYPYDHWNDEPFGTNTRDDDFNTMKLKLPGQPYQDIVADKLDTTARELIYDDGAANELPYVCYKDVTSLLQGLTNPNGDYFGANIKATLGRDTHGGSIGSSAGWVIVVIYENENDSSKNISVFDGFSTINPGISRNTDVTFDGFKTIPAGPVKAQFLTAALEGDLRFTGDGFQIRNQAGNYQYISRTGFLNNSRTRNFFNSSITKNDVDVTERRPKSRNTLGFDIGSFTLNNPSNSIITNNQTSLDVRFISTLDVYYPFLNVMAVEIIQPVIKLIKTVDDGAGNDLGGSEITLGSDLWYNVSFQNKGTDDATNTIITDRLPKNVNLLDADIVLPTGVTLQNYAPPSATNEYRGTLTLKVDDSLVKIGGAKHNIRLHIRVVNDCNSLRSQCSNVIENQAFASYDGIVGAVRVDGKPSFSGILDATCNIGVIGTSNFLVDIDECLGFSQSTALCGSAIDLVAGDGFDTYTWKDELNNIIGTSQTLTVTAPGVYTVDKVNTSETSVACLAFSEIHNVIAQGTQINPILSFVDNVRICPADSSELGEIYLCGSSDIRTISLNVSSSSTVRWQELNSSCVPSPDPDCPNTTNSCWVDVASNANSTSRNFSDTGQYRVIVEDSAGCFERYYFNVFRATMNPNIVTEDLVCGDDGSITINNVPSGYEFALVTRGSTDPADGDYQTSNIFPITASGIYDVYIKNDLGTCIFPFPGQLINSIDAEVDVSTEPVLCAADSGEINIQINSEIPGPYTYTISRIRRGGRLALVNNFGPTSDKSATFTVTNSNEYVVEVTTTKCSFTENVTFTVPERVKINPTKIKDINCTDGVIDLNPSGGTPPYTFAVWFYAGTGTQIDYSDVSDIPSSEFFTGTTYNVPAGLEGAYRFIVVDANNCSAISRGSRLSIAIEELQFDSTVTNPNCFGDSDGTITINTLTPPGLLAHNLEYSIDNGTTFQSSNIFSGLTVGNYTINIRATKGGTSCNYVVDPITINTTTLTGGGASATDLSCIPGGGINSGQITFTDPAGGTGSYVYRYKLNTNTAFLTTTATTVTGLSEGTYDVEISDTNGCSGFTGSVTINPLPVTPVLSENIVYNCDGTANVTISASPSGSYTYTLGSDSNTSGIFTNLPVNTHTVSVEYGSSCTEEIRFSVLDAQEFTATAVGSRVACNSDTNGQITITVNNFGSAFDYNIEGAGWVTANTVSPLTVTTSLGAGLYNVEVRSTGAGTTPCVITLNDIQITAPPQLTGLAVNISKGVSCNTSGGTIGASISGSVSGGTPPYLYDYQIEGTATFSAVSTGIPSGNHVIRVRDANGCELLSPFTISPPLSVGFDLNSTLCYDGSNGQISVENITGLQPFRIKLNAGSEIAVTGNSYLFTGLGANTYTVEVFDANDCSNDVSVTILPQLNASVTAIPVTCTPGSIVTTASGGSGNYTYAVVDDGNIPGNSDFDVTNNSVNRATGTYDVYVRDSNDCEAVYQDIEVISILPLTAAVTEIQPNCSTDTGALSITVSNGSLPYRINITGGSSTIPSRTGVGTGSENYAGVGAGTYNIEVIDSNNCSFTDTATITIPDPLTGGGASATDLSCILGGGSNSGQITFTDPAGGTGSYVYRYKLNTNTAFLTTTAATVTGLSEGTYDVEISDTNGCSGFTGSVTINPLPVTPVLSENIVYNCDGTANVTISASPSGSYTYTLGSDSNTSGIFTNLPVNTHTVSVEYGSSCTEEIRFSVLDAQEFTATAVGSRVACNSDTNGQITITVNNFGSAFDYNIEGAGWVTANTVSPLTVTTSLGAGLYNVEVRSTGAGTTPCVITLNNIQITAPPQLTGLTVNISKGVSCNTSGGTIGASISGTVAGGTPPYLYDYQIEGTATFSAVSTGIPSGNHVIRVRDANGCELLSPFTISPPLSVGFDLNPTLCYDGSNGQISVENITGLQPFRIKLNAGSEIAVTGNSYLFTGLGANTYTVEVLDANDCSNDVSVTISPQLNASVTAIPVTCTPGSIVTIASGGSGNYTYAVVDDGNIPGNSDFDVTNNSVNRATGTYDVYVRDSNDCEAVYQDIEVISILPLTAAVTEIQPNCSTDTGALSITVSNGSLPYRINITGGSSTIPSRTGVGTGSENYAGIGAGTYNIEVIDSNNCSFTDTATITIPDPLTGGGASATDLSCIPGGGSNSGQITFTDPAGGTGSYVYRYKLNTNTAFLTTTATTVTGLSEGTYDVEISDTNGCSGFTGSVTINPLPVTPVLSENIVYNCDGTANVTISASPSGSYTYTLGSDSNTSGIFTNLPVNTHTVSVEYGSSCTEEIRFSVLDAQEFTATAVGSRVACNSDTNGQITITVNNFGSAFDYNIEGAGWVTANTVSPLTVTTSLGAGLYNVEVRSTGAGTTPCVITLNDIQITAPPQLTGLAVNISKGVSCNTSGGTIGASISGSVSGGTPPYLYDYQIEGTATFSAVSTGIPSGNHVIRVRDANGCELLSPFTISPPLSVGFDLNPTLCYDGSNGQISVENITGLQPFRIKLNAGSEIAVTGNSYLFTGLGANTYTVEVFDANDCSNDVSVTILPQLNASVTAIPVTCTPGSIVTTASGGSGNYTYAVVDDGNIPGNSDFDVTNNSVNRATGTYDVYVRDSNDCEAVYQDIEVISILPLTAAVTEIQPNCSTDTGALSITVSNGSLPYRINITGGSSTIPSRTGVGTGSENYAGVGAGTYNIEVIDSNNCSFTDTATITIPDPLTGGGASATDLSCIPGGGSNSGQITFTDPAGGTGSYVYRYKLNTNTAFLTTTAATVTGLSEGTYDVEISDTNGCSGFTGSVTINPLPVTPVLSENIVYNCDGTANVTISASPSGSYTYTLGSDSNTSGIFTNLPVNTHTVSVEYGSSCTEEIRFSVLDAQEFTATAVGSRVACNSDTNGQITITVNNFGSAFDYNIEGAGWVTANTVSPLTVTTSLGAGLYNVEVRSTGAGTTPCVITLNDIQITAPPQLTGLAVNISKGVSCNTSGGTIGASISGTVAGGTPPYLYDYQIEGTATFSAVSTGIPSGNHVIRVRDANGCELLSPFTISPPLSVGFDLNPTLCYDGSNGQISVENITGLQPFRIKLNAGSEIAVTGNSYLFTGLGANTYTVEVLDANDCSNDVSVTISPQLNASVTVIPVTCTPGSIITTASGGSGNYTYAVVDDGNIPGNSDFDVTNNSVNRATGTYDVYVRDNGGNTGYCQYIIEDVVINEIDEVEISLVPNQPTCNGGTGSIDVTISNGEAPHTITIEDSRATTVQTIDNFSGTSLSLSNLVADTYTVEITDNSGCTYSVSETLADPTLLTASINPLRPDCGVDFAGNEGLFGYNFVGFPTIAGLNKIQFSIDNGTTWQDSPSFRGSTGRPDFNYGTITFPAIRITNAAESTTICFTSLGSFTMPLRASPLVVNITTDATDCTTGATATIDIDSGTGVGPFEYTYSTTSTPPPVSTPGWVGWQPPGGTTNRTFTFTGLESGRTYYFFTRDLGDSDCDTTENVIITDIDVVITPTVISQACNGSSNGSLQFSIDDTSENILNGGVSGIQWELFEIDLATGVTSSIEKGIQNNLDPILPTKNNMLPVGTYYLQITDTMCTFASPNIEILETASIDADLSVVNNIECTTSGVIRVENVTGGTAPYTYSLNSATNFNVVEANIIGNTIEFPYAGVINQTQPVTNITIEIADSNGNTCTTTIVSPDSLSVSQPPSLDTLSKTDNSCTSNGGEVSVTVSGGTSPYTATITDTGSSFTSTLTGSGTLVFSNLDSGSFTVSVVDANNCPAVGTGTVTINPDLDFSINTVSMPSCVSDSEFSIEVLSGSGNYSYTVTDPGSTQVAAGTMSGTGVVTDNFSLPQATPSGTYTVNVTDIDSGNCMVSKSFDIDEPAAPEFTVSVTDSSCSTEGSISVSVTRGLTPFSYNLSQTAGSGLISGQGVWDPLTNSFTNVPAGTYTVIVTGNNGCFTQIPDIPVAAPVPLVVSPPVPSQFACNPATNVNNSASLTIDVSAAVTGGSGVYPTIELYNDNLTPSDLSDDTQQTGGLTISATLYTFTLGDTTGGNYYIRVTDSQGCQAFSPSVNILPFDRLQSITATPNNPITCTNTGEIINIQFSSDRAVTGAQVTITDSSGTLTETIASVNSGTSVVNTIPLPADVYTISVIHPVTNCTLSTAYEVKPVPDHLINVNQVAPVACFDSATAEISIIFDGSTPYPGSYTYTVFDISSGIAITTGNGASGNTLQSISTLPSGDYYVEVVMTDSPGCTRRTSNFSIDSSASIIFSEDISGITCVGNNDGSIRVHIVSGGIGDYQYQLTGTATAAYSSNNLFENLQPGNYTITVKDSNNCEVFKNVILPDTAQANFTLSKTDNSCTSNGGEVSVTVSGGTLPYTATITDTGSSFTSTLTGSGTLVFSNLDSGSFTVSVVDANNCPAVGTGTVIINPDLDFSINTVSIPSCVSGSEFSIEVLSGSGNYSYTVTDPASTQVAAGTMSGTGVVTDNFILPQATPSGTYTVNVTDIDSGNCMVSKSFDIDEPAAPEFTVSVTDSSCSTEGSISVSVTRGLTPFSYSLSQTAGSGLSSGQGVWDPLTNSFTNVPAGTYTVIVTGNNGCFTQIPGIPVAAPVPLVVSPPVPSQFVCNPVTNVNNSASLTIDVSAAVTGGSGVYPTIELYNDNLTPSDLSDDTQQTGGLTISATLYTFTLGDTTGGNYYIRVTDSQGCQAFSPSVNILPFDRLQSITATPNNPITCTNTGEIINIQFSSDRAVTGAQVTITDSSGTLTETIASVNSGISVVNTISLPADVYTISVTHPTTSCTLSTAYEVKPVPDHLINVNQVLPIVCSGSTTAEINIIFDGSTPYPGSYTYTVFDISSGTAITTGNGASGNTLQSISALPSGDYYVEVVMTDSPGCTRRTSNFSIDSSLSIIFSEDISGITCVGNNDGSIRVHTVSGGLGGYQYQLTGTATVAYSSNNLFENLQPGNYTITVKDSNNCEDSKDVILPDTAQANFILSKTDNSCTSNGGEVSVTVSGGTLPYTATITDTGSSFTSTLTGSGTLVFSNLDSGSFTVSVVDANNCPAVGTGTVTINPDLDFSINTVSIPSCVSGSEFSIEVLSGSGNYSYTVTDPGSTQVAAGTMSGTGVITDNFTLPQATPSGTYTVNVTDIDSGNCMVFKSFDIDEPAAPEFTVSVTDSSCSTEGSISVSVTRGLTPFSYTLSQTAGSGLTSGQGVWDPLTNSFTNVPAGTYTVIVTGNNGCLTQIPDIPVAAPVPLVVSPPVPSQFVCNPATNVNNSASLTIDVSAAVTGGSGVYPTIELYNDNLTPSDLSDDTQQTGGLSISATLYTFTLGDTTGGNYYIRVTDSQGCQAFSPSVNILPFDRLQSITATPNNPITCTNTGEIINIRFSSDRTVTGAQVTITDSSGTLTETIAGVNINSGISIVNTIPLPADVYTISVIHPVTNCTLSTAYEVKPVPDHLINVNQVAPVACFDSATAEISIIFDGSTPYPGSYTYTVFDISSGIAITTGNGASGNTLQSISTLPSGDYYVEVVMTDSPGCTRRTSNFSIDSSASIIFSEDISGITCVGNNDGSIRVHIVSGGIGDYQYQLTGTATAAYSSNNLFENLQPGNYTITVKDSNNCEVFKNVILPDTAQANFTLSKTDNSCTSNGGEVSVTVSGGTLPYTATITDTGSSFTSTLTGSGTLVFSNLDSGSFTVSVVDANNCPAVGTGTVIINPDLDFSINTVSIPSCVSGSEFSIEVLSGSGNYSYTVTDPGSTQVADGTMSGTGVVTDNFSLPQATPSGTYTVNVTDIDSGNCMVSKSFDIDEPAAPEFTVSVTDSSCSTEGSISVSVTRGLTPFSYNLSQTAGSGLISGQGVWDPLTNSFTNVPAGTYTVIVTGNNGCFTQIPDIPVAAPVPLVVSPPVPSQFACNPATNVNNSASLTIDVSAAVTGGSGVYPTIELYNDNLTPSDLSDDTQQTGGLTISATLYTFTLGDTTGGNYYIRVTDSQGCQAFSPSVNILPFDRLQSITATPNNPITCTNTGEIINIQFSSDRAVTGAQVTITDSSGTLTETIASVNSGTSVVNTIPLPADVYTISVIHPVTNCTLSTAYEVKPVPDHLINVNQVAPVVCFGSTTAEISIIFDGSTPYPGSYTYTVFDISSGTAITTGNGTSGNTLQSISALPSGDYYVEVVMTDSPGCTRRTSNFSIDEPGNQLRISSFDVSLINCATNNSGEVIIRATGSGGYEYQLENTATSTVVQAFSSNNVVRGLTAGTYLISVVDNNGCIATDGFTLTDPTVINADPQVTTQIGCEGDETAVIRVNSVSGGQGDPPVYSYSLTLPNGIVSAIQSSNEFNNLGSGSYEVTVYDEFNCSNTFPITIDDPDRVTAIASVTNIITCTNPTATIEVTGTGGTGVAYTYSSDGINFVNSNIFSAGVGNHEFFVRDENGCISDSFLVSIPALESLIATLDTSSAFITCNGDANAVLSANATGGLGNYMYELLDGTGTIIQGPQDSNTFMNINPGIYSIKVISEDCEDITNDFEILDIELLVTTEDVRHISCNGATDGSITLNTIGGSGSYVYEINTEPGRFQEENVFNNLVSGTYTITVLDENGCINILDIKIEEPDLLSAEIDSASIVQQLCITDPVPSFTVDIMGGTPPYTLTLNDGSTPINLAAGATSHTFTNLNAGQLYVILVSDSKGCILPDNLTIQLEDAIGLNFDAVVTYDCSERATIKGTVADIYSNEVVYLLTGPESASNDTGIFNVTAIGRYTIEVTHANNCNPDSIEVEVETISPLQLAVDNSQINALTANASGGIPPYEYSIDGESFTSNNVFIINQTRDYVIKTRDSRGCEQTTTVSAIFFTIEVPNLFTPDGDGNQDFWYPLNIQAYHNIKVYIYDRYGRLLQNFRGVQEGWNGTYQNRLLPSGDYWYAIEFKEITGEEKRLMGHFTLYR